MQRTRSALGKRFFVMLVSAVVFLSLNASLGWPWTASAVTASGNFIKGMDLSSLQAIEEAGGVYYDESNQPIPDIFSYLKNRKSVNYVRLRIWNNPTNAFDAGDYCDKDHTVAAAQRIKSAGLKFLLDFHYSDDWADPATQTKPQAWKNLSYSQLVQAVYDYTADVLNSLKAVGAYPDMVQIGNEISGGFLWEEGRIDNWTTMAPLLNSAFAAVRDTTPSGQYCKIALHLAEGGDITRTRYFFDHILQYGVTDFDVIGLSYYAYWHGTLEDLKNNMNDIVSRYNKEVVVLETAYPFTNNSDDSYANMVTEEETKTAGLPATVANQKLMLQATMNTVANVNGSKGLGVFYWEPLWVATSGVGVGKGLGNQWENQALFDFNNKALDSLNAFQYTPSAAYNNRHIILYQPETIKVQVDTYSSLSALLPATVQVLRFDGTIDNLPVTWSGASRVNMGVVAAHTLTGTVSGLNAYPGAAIATPEITVILQRNLVRNGSFETVSDDTAWTIDRVSGTAGYLTNWDDSTPLTGTGSFHYWDDNAFEVSVSQSVYVTGGHSYRLNVWAQGSYTNVDFNNCYLYAYYYNSSGSKVSLGQTQIYNHQYGYGYWTEFSLENIAVPSGVGTITIGAHIQGSSGGYGTLDDFELLDNDASAPPVSVSNYLFNSGFEEESSYGSETYATLNHWNVSVANDHWPVNLWADTAYNHTPGGSYAFRYYDTGSYGFTLSSTLSNIPNGIYQLSVYSYGSSSGKTAALYGTSGGTTKTAAITDTNQWNSGPVWNRFTLGNIVVSGGTVTVGVTVSGSAGSWGCFDDFVLVKVG